MPKRFAFRFLLLLAPVLTLAVHAQDAPPPLTKGARFLHHFDLGLAGTAIFTKDVSGTVTQNAPGAPYTFTQGASTTTGALVSIRGEKSPWLGMELNYGYARNTNSYTCCNQSVIDGSYIGPFTSQSVMGEYTVGYMARPPHKFFGMQPYFSGGAGVMEFSPTRNGAVGLQKQARAAYYATGGIEVPVVSFMGLRAGVRELTYLAPDFNQSYLLIKKHTFTTEPQVGVFFHF